MAQGAGACAECIVLVQSGNTMTASICLAPISGWHAVLLLCHTTATLCLVLIPSVCAFFIRCVLRHVTPCLLLQQNLIVASCLLQIQLPTPGVDSPALEEDEEAPYQVMLKVMKDCLNTTRENRPEAFQVAYPLFKAAADARWL